MPIIKSALKKMRVDTRRTERNLSARSSLKSAIKKAEVSKKFDDVSAAYSSLDRAVKLNLVHKNFASRQKARLGKLAKPTLLAEKRPLKRSLKKSPRKLLRKPLPPANRSEQRSHVKFERRQPRFIFPIDFQKSPVNLTQFPLRPQFGLVGNFSPDKIRRFDPPA